MATEQKTVKIVPTWKSAASIYIMALEAGTPEGKQAARDGIYEMAEHLDRINAERNAEAES